MINVKVNNFSGLYTNVSDSVSKETYFNFIEGNINGKGIEAKKLIPEKFGEFEGEEIIKIYPFVLDNDRYGFDFDPEEGKYVSNYRSSLIDVLLVVTKDNSGYYIRLLNAENNTLIKFYKGIIKRNYLDYLDFELIDTYKLNGTFLHAISYDNSIYISTDKTIYAIKHVNRKGINRQYNGYYIYENYEVTKDDILVDIETKDALEPEKISVEKYFIVSSHIIDITKIEFDSGIWRVSPVLRIELTLIGSSGEYIDRIGFYYNESTGKAGSFKSKEGFNIVKFLYRYNDKEYSTDSTTFGSNSTKFYVAKSGDKVTALKVNVGDQALIFDVNGKIYFSGDSKQVEINIEYHVQETFKKEIIKNSNGYINHVYVTVLKPNGEEYLVDKIKLTNPYDKFYFKLIINATKLFLLRFLDVYKVRLYLENGTAELFYELNLFEGKISDETLIDNTKLSGIYIDQTLGFSYNKEYNILRSFDSGVVIKGIPFLVKNGLVYYPNIANANVVFVFNEDNVINRIRGKFLVNVSDNLGVIQEDRLSLIVFNVEEGIFIYYLKDEIGIVLEKIEDSIGTPDGAIIKAKNGIFLSDGSNTKKISEPIDNLIAETKGKIMFNVHNSELYYLTDNNLYVYDFKYNIWKNNSLDIILGELIYSKIGKLFYFNNNEYGMLDYKDSKCKIVSKDIDLNELNIYKRLNYITFNGRGNIDFIYNNEVYSLNLDKKNSIFIPLDKKIPQKAITYSIILYPNSAINNYVINLELFRGFNEYTVQAQ